MAAVDTMLWGPINVGLEVAQRMRARGRGRIGVITSMGGLISAPHLLPYSTAKFGAVGFARGLRSELSGTGVSVTTVAPGLMRTGSHLRAQFLGDHGREFAWFGTAASLPLLSMDAERAAGIIVRGILNRRAVVTTTPLAKIVPRVDALFPGLAVGGARPHRPAATRVARWAGQPPRPRGLAGREVPEPALPADPRPADHPGPAGRRPLQRAAHLTLTKAVDYLLGLGAGGTDSGRAEAGPPSWSW